MRALLALAVVVPICLVAAYVIRSQTMTRKKELAPNHDLATAVRLLDRVSEADEVMPYLPSDTRGEVRAFLRRYHGREIG